MNATLVKIIGSALMVVGIIGTVAGSGIFAGILLLGGAVFVVGRFMEPLPYHPPARPQSKPGIEEEDPDVRAYRMRRGGSALSPEEKAKAAAWEKARLGEE